MNIYELNTLKLICSKPTSVFKKSSIHIVKGATTNGYKKTIIFFRFFVVFDYSEIGFV